ncbi:MAG: hypothetical protein JWP69_2081 [Flaviaesturariibacter sp.]|nr:hypothetical protein [Flaviaesturariibacter sp.]
MKYSVLHKRELNDEEKAMLQFLFSVEKPEWLDLLTKIKVIARCGCGKCPTILLGTSFQDEPQINQTLLIDYIGVGANGEQIGVTVFGNNEIPTELEFWSIDGQVNDVVIPDLETLRKMPTN